MFCSLSTLTELDIANLEMNAFHSLPVLERMTLVKVIINKAWIRDVARSSPDLRVLFMHICSFTEVENEVDADDEDLTSSLLLPIASLRSALLAMNIESNIGEHIWLV